MSLSTPKLTTVPLDAGFPTKLKVFDFLIPLTCSLKWRTRPRILTHGVQGYILLLALSCTDVELVHFQRPWMKERSQTRSRIGTIACVGWRDGGERCYRWDLETFGFQPIRGWGAPSSEVNPKSRLPCSMTFSTQSTNSITICRLFSEVPISDSVRVIAVPTAGLGVFSHPDKVICDGTAYEVKVGFGEVKPPWVMKTIGALTFANRLPFNRFGEDFISNIESEDAQKNVDKGLTQRYSNLLNDGLSLGFLATTEIFFFCCINPEDRGEFQVFPLMVDRIDLPRNGAPSPFTVQMGLATLAWMGRKPIFGEPREMPGGLALWSN